MINYNKKVIKLYMLLSIIIFVTVKKEDVVYSMYMAHGIILLFLVLSHKKESIGSRNKKERMISGILTILGLLMLGVFGWPKVLQVLIIIPSLVIALYGVIVFFVQRIVGFDIEVSEVYPSQKEVRVCLGIIVLGVILFMLSAYPGIFHSDGTHVLKNILNGGWGDWHPITYILFLRLCIGGIKHPFMVVLIQSGLFVITQYQILKLLERYCRKNTCYFYTGTILTAGVTTFFYLDVFYKDTLHFIGFLGFSIALLSCMKNPQKRKRDYLILFLYAFFTACMRHMSIGVVVITLIIATLLLVKDKKKKAALHMLVVSIVVVISFWGLRNVLLETTETEKNPQYVSYTIPLHMLGSYAASGENIDSETVELLNEIMPIEQWKEGYLKDPYLADTLSRTWGVIGMNLETIVKNDLYNEIISANWRYLCSYPNNYLRDFFNINTMVWEIGTPVEGYEWAPATFENCDDTLVSLLPEYEVKHTLATGLLGPYIDASKKMPVWRMISYRGGFFNFLILIVFLAFLGGKKQREDWIVCVPAMISGLFSLISIPAQDPRFVLPAIAVGCFVLSYAPNRISKLDE